MKWSLAIACQQDRPDSRLNNVDGLGDRPGLGMFPFAACPDICPSHEAIKQTGPDFRDIAARKIDVYLQEARSPRLSFLLDPSHAAYDIGRLERGNPSKAHRPSLRQDTSEPNPRLCDRPFDFHVTASLLGTIATAFCRDGQLERPGDVICEGNRSTSAAQVPSNSHSFTCQGLQCA